MFWNVNRKSLGKLVASACREHSVDVLILAESEMSSAELTGDLNSGGEYRYYAFNPAPSTLAFYVRLPLDSVRPVFDDGRTSIRRIKPPLGPELLVVACHLPSKRYSLPEDQAYRARILRRQIMNAEAHVGHRNSLVIGDLNMNPFEDGMNAADGLHAVMDKRIAQRDPRVVQGESWDFFYNPMWSRLGDESEGPSGTYYYQSPHLVSYHWHTFDQVLLRPGLLPFYESKHLQVLTRINGTQLVTNNGLAGTSDHLPIVIRLETEKAQADGK